MRTYCSRPASRTPDPRAYFNLAVGICAQSFAGDESKSLMAGYALAPASSFVAFRSATMEMPCEWIPPAHAALRAWKIAIRSERSPFVIRCTCVCTISVGLRIVGGLGIAAHWMQNNTITRETG